MVQPCLREAPASPDVTPCGSIGSVGPVVSLEELVEAWSLVYGSYRRLGLIPPNPYRVHTTPSAMTPRSLVMIHRPGREIRGTVTAMGDSVRAGLPLQHVFPDEIARMRREGGRLMEFGLLAHAGDACDLAALVDLLRTAFCYGIATGYTDLLCGVAPHHARFYEVMFGFRRESPPTVYPHLNDAPVVLLRARAEEVFESRRRLRGLAKLGEMAFSPERFERGYCPSEPEVAGSVIGQFLWARGTALSPSCSREGCRLLACA